MSHPTTPTYDVFLSFRGEDTRQTITSHLYAELNRKKIKTFIDDKLERGDEISPSLIKAMEESSIYVVILSKHYASSTWCLDELTKILKCKERYGREVIPVFYEVDPTDVRYQKNSYEEDLVKHQQRSKDKIDAWKAALFHVAGLSGLDSKNIRPESTLVEKIAKDILKKLNRCVVSDCEGMIGIDEHIERIKPLLLLDSPSVRIIGIWGMGGIGKTTIASAIYRKLSTQFSSRSIVLNVGQEIERAGLDHVRRKYSSELLEEDITSSNKSIFSFDPRLKRTKVLIVLDDVKDSDQLEDLIGTHSNFGQGSRIIVTNRDKQVLNNANVDDIYHVKEMDNQDSLQLFCLFAFKGEHPIEPYASLSKKVLDYAKGVPIALKVLGKFLQGRKKEAWESQLLKLQKLPDDKIFSVLKLSYDGLDEQQKDIFLDIACFFRGEFENSVVQTLECCGFNTRIGMNVLEDRCLISISEKGRVWMHDLIQEMGHEIVRLECVKECGKRSQLWKRDDIYDVLSKNKGTDAIQCIFLHMEDIGEGKLEIHAETFKKMHHLRMMHFYDRKDCNSYVTFHSFLKSFPDDLKFLHWDGFPQRSLPLEFCPEYLVTLAMPCSHLEQLWDEDQALPKLKRLNLRSSEKLIRLPDLSLSPNIEEIILSDCVSLEKIYSSNFLNDLNWLCLDGCTALRSLMIRSNILWRPSGLVALRGCLNLETLLISSTTDVVQSSSWSCCFDSAYKTIQVFDDKTWIQPDAMGGCRFSKNYSNIKELCWLDASNCESLTHLPAELLNLKFLRRLSFSGCLKLEELPEIKETMENLRVLILDKTAIKELPSSLHHLVGLEKLSLRSCTKFKTIPSSIGNLSKLLKLDLTGCISLETIPSSFGNLSKLLKLNLTKCESFETFPDLEVTMENLRVLILDETTIKELLPSSLNHLVRLEELSLRCCKKLKTIPSSIGNLSKLLKLDLIKCESFETFPELEVTMENLQVLILDETAIKELLPSSLNHLVRLEELSLRCCKKLKTIPSSIGNLSKLHKLDLTGCISLETIPSSFGNLSKLLKLNLTKCESFETFPELKVTMENLQVLILDETAIKELLPSSLNHLVRLEELSLRCCKKLKTIPSSIGNLSKLFKLDLAGCESLEIVNLLEAESMAHLSNLKSLDLSDCKWLECIPKLPPNLNELKAYDCPSIKGMESKLLSDSKEGIFKFHLTNCQELDALFFSNIAVEARVKITDGAYWSVFICFPGSQIPFWFPYRCQGHSVTVKKDSSSLYGKNRLNGVALCVVLGREDMDDTSARYKSLSYKLSFEYDGRPRDFYCWVKRFADLEFGSRFINQDHTFLWKYQFDLSSIGNELYHANSFTFEILDDDLHPLSFQSTFTVKECGMCPLYAKDNGIAEPSGSKAAQ